MIVPVSLLSATTENVISSTVSTKSVEPAKFERLLDESGSINVSPSSATGTESLLGAELHDVMLQMEVARMHLGLLVEVRNKLLEGYHEIVRIQL